HPSIAEPIKAQQLHGYSSRELSVDSQGLLNEDLQQLPWPQIRLATLLLAHNETGVIQNPLPLAEDCESHQIPLHLDAVQAVGKIEVNFHALRATSLSFAPHKFRGPRGIGGLLIRKEARLTPLLHGGHQEHDRRPGTESVPLIAGMARALELWHQNREVRMSRLKTLRDQFEQLLMQAIGEITIIGATSPRLPNTSTIAFHGLDGEALLVALDLAGIACSQGSTCASGSSEPAPILIAMGIPADRQLSAIRFSLGHQQTTADIEMAAARITRIVKQLRTATQP
ncbi:MAG: aminotransferase class V-fold PLP-dependent enzyme, partial [Planctomycetaceae bacterium]|nr:aminotransferase class V-fold PLP-dependent enzyme [Planctomycetaceae bacterium]